MSRYTIKNRDEIENQAPKFGLAPELEARFGREPLECEQVGVSYQRLAPGFRIPFGHKHANQEEIYVLVNGSGRVKIEDEVLDVRQWDFIRVASGTMRNFEAGPDGAEIIAFGSPAAGADDLEMVQGWWTD